MYCFYNDYSEGCHERILEVLTRTNREQTVGYGCDPYCERARDLIRREIGRQDADVWFIPGGTQTNLLTIAAALRPWEAVMGAETCHINVHETGSIEATGHKVLTAPDPEGKLRPEAVLALLAEHEHAPHMVKPRMVYLSQSTELGTIYTRAELQALHTLCREKDLLLYVDGARLGVALTAEGNDVTLRDLAELCDAFYIGGTKNGAMMGEALVLLHPELRREFLYIVKQRGALFAKGRLLGIQFATLFEDGLYYELARHANREAMRLRDGMRALGVRFLTESPTNQQFIILPTAQADAVAGQYGVEEQWRHDGESCLRLVTSWATPPEAVTAFLADLEKIIK